MDLEARVLATMIVGVIGLTAWFSIDVILFLTGKDFGRVNISLVYFTRNDFASKSDALHVSVYDHRVALNEVYRNRFMFWWVMFESFSATIDKPVLDFGGHADRVLGPIRGRVASKNAQAEVKRMSGLPFKETSCQMMMVYDRSEHRKGHYVLRVLIFRTEDLKRFADYEANPPATELNFELVQKIAEAYRTKNGSFIRVRMVAA